MNAALGLVILFSIGSCATAPITGGPETYFKRMESVPLGASQGDVERAMGKPDVVQKDGGETAWAYNVKWKSHEVPKAIVWFDSSGKVIEKEISLADQHSDEMTKEQAEKHFSSHRFVQLPNPPPKNLHHYSSLETLYSEETGVQLIYNKSRSNLVETVRWRTPESQSRTDVTSP